MTLTIDVPDKVAERWRTLSEDARREHEIAIADLLAGDPFAPPKFVEVTSPEVSARLRAIAAAQLAADTAMFAQWEKEEEEDIDLETLKANMNANRAASGEEPIF